MGFLAALEVVADVDGGPEIPRVYRADDLHLVLGGARQMAVILQSQRDTGPLGHRDNPGERFQNPLLRATSSLFVARTLEPAAKDAADRSSKLSGETDRFDDKIDLLVDSVRIGEVVGKR
jgi:hypothetical protein